MRYHRFKVDNAPNLAKYTGKLIPEHKPVFESMLQDEIERSGMTYEEFNDTHIVRIHNLKTDPKERYQFITREVAEVSRYGSFPIPEELRR
jgi:hypothetical protein